MYRASTKPDLGTPWQPSQGFRIGGSCLPSHLVCVSLVPCSFVGALLGYEWGIVAGETWAPRTLSWAPFSWWVGGIRLSSQPCRAFPSEVPYTFAFVTPQCSLCPWTSSVRSYWIISTTGSFITLNSRLLTARVSVGGCCFLSSGYVRHRLSFSWKFWL